MGWPGRVLEVALLVWMSRPAKASKFGLEKSSATSMSETNVLKIIFGDPIEVTDSRGGGGFGEGRCLQSMRPMFVRWRSGGYSCLAAYDCWCKWAEECFEILPASQNGRYGVLGTSYRRRGWSVTKWFRLRSVHLQHSLSSMALMALAQGFPEV